MSQYYLYYSMDTLYTLEEDKSAEIVSLNNNNAVKVRLAEMGIMPGIGVRMIKKTPFGGPVHIKINNYYITLRKEDASLITIKSLES